MQALGNRREHLSRLGHLARASGGLAGHIGDLALNTLEEIFGVVPLGLADWAIVLFFSVQPLLLMELVKWVYPEERWRARGRTR